MRAGAEPVDQGKVWAQTASGISADLPTVPTDTISALVQPIDRATDGAPAGDCLPVPVGHEVREALCRHDN